MANQQSCSFQTEIKKSVSLNYLLHLPSDYGDDPAKKWPLILFLHGAGERGDNLEQVKLHGIAKVVEQQTDFPFITVSPQCPTDTWWSNHSDALIALLDDIAARYAVDTNRVYLTGLSMGGFGSWHLAALYPERFAAIVPICGGGHWAFGFPDRVCVFKDVPVWVFHGAKDPVVPVEASRVMVEALQVCGGDVRFTVYPEAGHDSWTETYNNPALYEWFLSHSR
jgi:predicted peptidase